MRSWLVTGSGFRVEVPYVKSDGFDATNVRATQHGRKQPQQEQRTEREPTAAAVAWRSARAAGPSSMHGGGCAVVATKPAQPRPVSAHLAATPPPSMHTQQLVFTPSAATHRLRVAPRSRVGEIKILRRNRAITRVCGAWLANTSTGEAQKKVGPTPRRTQPSMRHAYACPPPHPPA